MRQRRVAPEWLVDPVALMAVAASRPPGPMMAPRTPPGMPSLTIETRFIDGKIALQLMRTTLPA